VSLSVINAWRVSLTKLRLTTAKGVPAAFSPSCSENHIPGYINSPKLKDAGKVFVVSVNDPFV
jgi:peroxiredoxin